MRLLKGLLVLLVMMFCGEALSQLPPPPTSGCGVWSIRYHYWWRAHRYGGSGTPYDAWACKGVGIIGNDWGASYNLDDVLQSTLRPQDHQGWNLVTTSTGINSSTVPGDIFNWSLPGNVPNYGLIISDMDHFNIEHKCVCPTHNNVLGLFNPTSTHWWGHPIWDQLYPSVYWSAGAGAPTSPDVNVPEMDGWVEFFPRVYFLVPEFWGDGHKNTLCLLRTDTIPIGGDLYDKDWWRAEADVVLSQHLVVSEGDQYFRTATKTLTFQRRTGTPCYDRNLNTDDLFRTYYYCFAILHGDDLAPDPNRIFPLVLAISEPWSFTWDDYGTIGIGGGVF